MDSPLDAFSPENPPDAPPRRETNPPRDPLPRFRNTRRTTLVNRLRRRLIDAVDWVADSTVAVAALVRAPRRWIITARWGALPPRPAWATNERLAVIATAAFTSAAVSQFTLWMGSDRSTSAVDASVTNVSAPADRSAPPVALELPADRAASQRFAARTPTATPNTPIPAMRTPLPPASLPETLVQDDGVSQDAMLLQDRPVLMDPWMLVDATASAPLRSAPAASLAPDRNSALSPISPRPRSGGNGVVARPAAAPAGLVVITQPEGARVTINGVGWGMTPLTIGIGQLPPGAKRVRITKPGYRSEERVVATDPEQPPATLRIALREAAKGRPQQ
jgi:hypothetical protein